MSNVLGRMDLGRGIAGGDGWSWDSGLGGSIGIYRSWRGLSRASFAVMRVSLCRKSGSSR